MKMTALTILFSLVLICTLTNLGQAEYKLVCYYTNWSQYRNGIGKFFPPDIEPNLCTHIIYAFGKLVGNKITNFEWNDNDEYNNLYAQVNAHKQQNPKLKTLLAMGGWTAGSLIYSNMASTAANRKEFIDSSIAWLRKYNFDGLDMDWEYPANRDGKPYDKVNFAHLCKETREAFDNEAATTGKERLLFTSAVGAGRSVIDSAYDVPVMAQYMDFICLMTYDLHGSWESFTGLHTGLYASNNDPDKTLNVASAAEYWHRKGAPREKLIIGLGTYGRSFTLADASNHGVGAPASDAGAPGPYTREKGFLSYYEICEMQKSGQGTTYRDPVAKVPYFVNPSTKLWVGFDDKTSIYTKITELIVKDGYGGAMTWALPLDDFKGTICGEGKYPLISLMKETLEAADGGGPVNPPSTNQPVTNAPTTAGPTVGPTNAPVTTLSPVTTTGGGGSLDVICARTSHGFVFPNVYDCTSYYQCVYEKAVQMPCQSGLYFNPLTNACDWPSNVECSQITTTTNSIRTTLAPTTKSPTLPPTTNAPSTAKPTDMCPYDGAIRDPNDCSSYYLCWNGAVIRLTKKCPTGELFSSTYKVCDRADRVNCNDNPPSTASPTTKQPTTSKPTTTASPTTKQPTTSKPTTTASPTTKQPTTSKPKTTASPTTKQPTTSKPTTTKTTAAPSTASPTTQKPTTVAPSTKAPVLANPCINEAHLLHPASDCTKYIQCVHGQPITRPCNPPLQFSPTLRTCTWSYLAGCQQKADLLRNVL